MVLLAISFSLDYNNGNITIVRENLEWELQSWCLILALSFPIAWFVLSFPLQGRAVALRVFQYLVIVLSAALLHLLVLSATHTSLQQFTFSRITWRALLFSAITILIIGKEYSQRWLIERKKSTELRNMISAGDVEALKRRIDPPYLFELLDSLQRLINKDVRKADQFIARLSAYLRCCINTIGKDSCAVDKELDTVRSYLELERNRTYGQLQWEVEVDPGSGKTLLPCFLIQRTVKKILQVLAGDAPCIKMEIGGRDLTHVRISAAPVREIPRMDYWEEPQRQLQRFSGSEMLWQQSSVDGTLIVQFEIPAPVLPQEQPGEPVQSSLNRKQRHAFNWKPDSFRARAFLMGMIWLFIVCFSHGRATKQDFGDPARLLRLVSLLLWGMITPLFVAADSLINGTRMRRVKLWVVRLLLWIAMFTGTATLLQYASHHMDVFAVGENELWTMLISQAGLALIYFLVILFLNDAIRFYVRFKKENHLVCELQEQLARARIYAIHLQLNPHFLFNVLNSISALLGENVVAAEVMLLRLREFFRMTLDRGEELEIPLDQELHYLDCYLKIQETRFLDRLKVETSVASDANKDLVPPLLLQPIVENAIRHGMRDKHSGGRIDLHAERCEGKLQISIKDNGPGLAIGYKEGFGLSHTRERLKRLYGAESRFLLAAIPDGGLCVTIQIPVNRGER